MTDGGENQDRANRPRPAVCLSARITVAEGACFLAISSANALVEGNSSKTKRDSSSILVGRRDAKDAGDNTNILGQRLDER